MSSQAKKDAALAQFRSVTGANQNDALKFMKKHSYRVDVAVDSFFESGIATSPVAASNVPTAAPSTQNITALFEKYKDSPDAIGIDGTIKLCQDLEVEPEDVVTLALAYELKSPGMGEWPRKEWMEGMKALKCDSITNLKAKVPQLRHRLSSDIEYFAKVYTYTFTFGLAQGQRSLPSDVAVPFWSLLLPVGLSGGALQHVDDLSSDPPTSTYPGWRDEHNQWWFDYLESKAVKGISKDTWTMFIDFVRTIDDKFEKHDTEGSWPSLIDDFVEYAQAKAAGTT